MGSYHGDPLAFWFDRTIVNFGSMVEQDLERVGKNSKDEKSAEAAITSRLIKWLDYDGTLTKQRFAAPPITKWNEGGD